MTFAEIELKIADFAKRAKDGKLTLEELTGGTFTISNGGVFGSLFSTPIINPLSLQFSASMTRNLVPWQKRRSRYSSDELLCR